MGRAAGTVPGPAGWAGPRHAVKLAAGVLLLLAGLGSPAAAQACGTVEPGDRVRLTLRDRPPALAALADVPPGAPVEGILVHLDLERVVLERQDEELEIPRWYVESVEEWCRPERRLGPGSSALVGGIIGGIVAGGVAACLADDETTSADEGRGRCHPDRDPDLVGTAAVSGLVVGALIGLAVGSWTGDRAWTPARLELRTGPGPVGGWRIGVRIPVGGG